MRNLRLLTASAVLGLGLLIAPAAQAARIGVQIGVGPVYVGPPVCEYGYYDYYPYACAPYGYYGPDWFSGGVFIGAGPWGHGWRGGYGHGYYGRVPAYGHPGFRGEVRGNFHGNFHGGGTRGGGGFHGGGGYHRGGGNRHR